MPALTGQPRYWSRKFKKHMERKRASRMAGMPGLTIPDIFVDAGGGDEGGRRVYRP